MSIELKAIGWKSMRMEAHSRKILKKKKKRKILKKKKKRKINRRKGKRWNLKQNLEKRLS